MKYYFVFSIRLTKKHPSYKKAKREVSGKGFILASVLQKKTVSAYFLGSILQKIICPTKGKKVSIGFFYF
jgi:hypothetical protein